MKNRHGLHLIMAFVICLLLATVAVACSEPYSAQVPPSLPAAEQPSVDVLAPQDLPVIADFSADYTEITEGSLATLLWTVEGATTVSIDQGVGYVGADATTVVRPHKTTTYTLTATNAAGSVSKTMVINVKPLPRPDAPSSDASYSYSSPCCR